MGAYSYTQRDRAVRQLYPLTFQPNGISVEYREKIRDFLQQSHETKYFSCGQFKQGDWSIKYTTNSWWQLTHTYINEDKEVLFSDQQTDGINCTKNANKISFRYSVHFPWEIRGYSENRFILEQLGPPEFHLFQEPGEQPLIIRQKLNVDTVNQFLDVFKDILTSTIFDLRHINPNPTFYYISNQKMELSQLGWNFEQEIFEENYDTPLFLYKFTPSTHQRVSQISLAFGLGYDSEPAIPNKSARNDN